MKIKDYRGVERNTDVVYVDHQGRVVFTEMITGYYEDPTISHKGGLSLRNVSD